MTVRRHSDDNFAEPPPEVARAVRAVLACRPPYVKADELEKDTIFRTNVKPNWWLLGTEMVIRLDSSSGGTRVRAETRSQWFILGDIFGYYNEYIRDFFGALRAEIEKQGGD